MRIQFVRQIRRSQPVKQYAQRIRDDEQEQEAKQEDETKEQKQSARATEPAGLDESVAALVTAELRTPATDERWATLLAQLASAHCQPMSSEAEEQLREEEQALMHQLHDVRGSLKPAARSDAAAASDSSAAAAAASANHAGSSSAPAADDMVESLDAAKVNPVVSTAAGAAAASVVQAADDYSSADEFEGQPACKKRKFNQQTDGSQYERAGVVIFDMSATLSRQVSCIIAYGLRWQPVGPRRQSTAARRERDGRAVPGATASAAGAAPTGRHSGCWLASDRSA